MRLPPYGRRLVVGAPPFNLVMIYIGEPECWQYARRDQQAGMHNHLVLPLISEVAGYSWPVEDCSVIAVDYSCSDEPEVIPLVYTIYEAGAKALAIAQGDPATVVEYKFNGVAA